MGGVDRLLLWACALALPRCSSGRYAVQWMLCCFGLAADRCAGLGGCPCCGGALHALLPDVPGGAASTFWTDTEEHFGG